MKFLTRLLVASLALLVLFSPPSPTEGAPPAAEGRIELAPTPPTTMKKWPVDLEYDNCEPFLDGSHLREGVRVKSRLRLSDEQIGDFGTSCSDIHSRGYYPPAPVSEDEANFPIAFATNVFKDYAMVEKVLSVMYQPQNHYCYAIDSKASPLFKERVRNLASCFPNVMVAEEELDVKSSGVGTSAAHLSCMRALKPYTWNYLALLQSHDFPLRTNAELVEVFKQFGGANDISAFRPTASSPDGEAVDTSLVNLHLYRDGGLLINAFLATESKNRELYKGQHHRRLRLSKSLVGVSLSRTFVDWVLDELDVSGFVDELEKKVAYGMDEDFLATLNSNDLLHAPGGFTKACIDRGISVGSVSRHAVWLNDVRTHPRFFRCGVANEKWRFRHGVCVFGLEDLHRLTRRPELFANKFMPSFDYGALSCWMEHLYNRTHFADKQQSPGDAGLDLDYYAKLPHVRYHRMKELLEPGERWNKYAFDCTSPRITAARLPVLEGAGVSTSTSDDAASPQ